MHATSSRIVPNDAPSRYPRATIGLGRHRGSNQTPLSPNPSPAPEGRALNDPAQRRAWPLSGLTAWLVWALIHLMYLVQFQSRVLVFIQWAIQDLTFDRGSRLITGSVPTDFKFEDKVASLQKTSAVPLPAATGNLRSASQPDGAAPAISARPAATDDHSRTA